MDQEEKNNAEEIRKKFSELPADIKALAYSADMMAVIKQVAEKNQLHIDKIEPLEGEAVDVMTGYTAPRDFVQSLMDNLEVDKIKAEAIAKDVNELLFSKIRESMKQVSGQAPTTLPTSNPPAMSAPAAVTGEKSVVMPSTIAKSAPAAVTPAPVIPPPAPAPAPTVPFIPAKPKPAELPAMTHIDAMLSQPTVSVAPKVEAPALVAPAAPVANTPKPAEAAKVEPPKPGPIYKTDPYLEPID